VETLQIGGAHTAVLKVRAEVCLRCGGRLRSQEMIRRFEEYQGEAEAPGDGGVQADGAVVRGGVIREGADS